MLPTSRALNGGKDSCTSQRLWGCNPAIHIDSDTEIGGSHMSRKHSTALGISAAVAGAAVATFLSMGTAYADIPGTALDADGYSDLYGALGNENVTVAQGTANAALDQQLLIQDPTTALSFDHAVDIFESSNVHAVADLINAVDPSAFVLQSDPDIIGTVNAAGEYLVPVDSLGYLAQSVDFFLLDPTGLGFLLSPVIEILLGSPPF